MGALYHGDGHEQGGVQKSDRMMLRYLAFGFPYPYPYPCDHWTLDFTWRLIVRAPFSLMIRALTRLILGAATNPPFTQPLALSHSSTTGYLLFSFVVLATLFQL